MGLYIVDCRMYIGCWKLGSFRRNRGRRDAGYAEIGFVSHKYGVAGHLVYGNWVRFAFLGVGPGGRGGELGSFRIFGSWAKLG